MRFRLAIAIWVLSTVIIFLVAGYRLDLPAFISLKNNGGTVEGTIVDWDAKTRIITYSYVVDSKTFTSELHSNKGYPIVGENLHITYSREDPTYHKAGPLWENLRAALVVCLVLSFIPSIIGLGILVRLFNREQELKS
jgi:hypothetical protein